MNKISKTDVINHARQDIKGHFWWNSCIETGTCPKIFGRQLV